MEGLKRFFSQALVLAVIPLLVAIIAPLILTSLTASGIAPFNLALLITLTSGGVIVAAWIFYFFLERPGNPLKSIRKRRLLVKYLTGRRQDLLKALAPGSTELRVKDIVDEGGLFIDLPWAMQHQPSPDKPLVDYIVEALHKEQNVLILGQVGQGKSIVLKRIFTVMIARFLNNHGDTTPLPIFIPLRELRFSSAEDAEILWACVNRYTFPLSQRDFTDLLKKNQIIFIFDGFDEIPRVSTTQYTISERADSSIFARPALLSCRKSFYELYLTNTAIQASYSTKIELRPLTFADSIAPYIRSFWHLKQNRRAQQIRASSEQVTQAIKDNKELMDLAQRPLLLTMMLDIFSDSPHIQETFGSMADLYEQYTEKWLKHETSRPNSVLNWEEKAALMQEIAWAFYVTRAPGSAPYSIFETVSFTKAEISIILQNHPIVAHHNNFQRVVDDICQRTFLIASEADHYYFIHKSFQEFLVAKYIFERIRQNTQRVDRIGQALQELIPVQVATFLKGLLKSKRLSTQEKRVLADTLIKVYQQNSGEDTRSVMIRQHASYYVGYLETPRGIHFLEQSYGLEPNKLVQRGMMVGLALSQNRADIIEQYISFIDTDAEAALINAGYHLVYYGDQPLEVGYIDQGDSKCDGTVWAIFRHLKNQSYKKTQTLDLYTLRTLLETRGVSILQADEQYIPFLRDYLARDHSNQPERFQQELERIRSIVLTSGVFGSDVSSGPDSNPPS